MKHMFRVFALPAALLALAAHAQQADSNLARNLAASCSACHGTDGRSVGGNVALAGMPKEAMLKSMADFKQGKRPATIMHQLAKGYSDAQIELIAGYFAAQKAN